MTSKNNFRLSMDLWGKIIASIYEAAIENKWKNALRMIGAPIGSHCGEIVGFDSSHYNDEVYLQGASENELNKLRSNLSDEINAGLNIRYQHVVNDMKGVGYWSDRDYIEEKDMARHRYYQESFSTELDVYHCAGYVLERNSDHITSIQTFRSKSAGGYQRPEIDYFRKISPHVLRAVELGRIQRIRNLSLENSFKTIRSQPGVILFNQSGCIVDMDRKSASICCKNDGITDRNRQLHLADRKSLIRLNNEIKELICKPIKISTSTPQYIHATRPSGKPPYKLFVSPITNRIDNIYGFYGVVYVFDNGDQIADKTNLLKKYYRLTPSEINLTIALSEGESIQSYADRTYVSIETPRFHLKNIFIKTETNRQSELVVKINKLFSDYSAETLFKDELNL